MKKLLTLLALSVLTALSTRAQILFQDSSNYPYADGCIETQGQWNAYSPKSPDFNVFVTNNVLLLSANHTNDSVATPTNGWVNPGDLNFASFTLNVSQLPTTADGGYFAEFQNLNDSNDCCHLFIDTHDTIVPGTFRLGIANFANSYGAVIPPNNYPLDLVTGITYTVVMLYGGQDPTFPGSYLFINPSEQDYINCGDDAGPGDGIGDGYVYGDDKTTSAALLTLVPNQIGFGPYVAAGISNLVVAADFDDILTTNLPVIGVQPLPGTNYSGESFTFYSASAGVDLTNQWYGPSGPLVDDGINIIGSESNILVISNLTGLDQGNYYLVVGDPYGNMATSSNADLTVITTATAPFFPSEAPLNLTNNLFTYTGFTNVASGTGPLFYQWFFAPATNSSSYSPLNGQNSSALVLFLADNTYAGNYYVVASNSVSGGSIAVGPTNSITEIAPITASMTLLHQLMLAQTNLFVSSFGGNTTYINSNNVTVSGYVTTYGGFGNSYTEYYIQDTNGYGIQVYIGKLVTGSSTYYPDDTNTPPIGSYVTVTGPIEIYNGVLEVAPSLPVYVSSTNSLGGTNYAASGVLAPRLANSIFNNLATNSSGTNGILLSDSLITLTNVYLYGSKTGGAIGNSGLFYSNSYSSGYITIGPYNASSNTNVIEFYQFGYNYPNHSYTPPIITNSFADLPVPTHCYQLTGVLGLYYTGGALYAEIVPSRLADYVTSAPSYTPGLALVPDIITNTVGRNQVVITNSSALLSWQAQYGSTYTVYSTTNLLSPWMSTGVGYYPTNSGLIVDTNQASAKYYRITSP